MTTQVRKNVMDMFIDGARRGFTIATTSLLPNVVMAFVIIQALKVTGLLEIVGRVCEPVMALWGLPGESATVLLAAKYPSLLQVVAGTTAGMLLANVPVVALGSRFAAKLPLKAARIAAACVFLLLGLWAAIAGIGG